MGKLHICRPDGFSSVLGFHHLTGNSRLRSKEVVVPIVLPSFCTFDKSMQFGQNSTRPLTLTWRRRKRRWSKSQRCKNQRREPLRSVSIKTLDRVVGDQGKAQRFKGTEEHCRQDSQTASADFFSFCTKKCPFSFVMKPRVQEVFDPIFHVWLELGRLRTRGGGVSDALWQMSCLFPFLFLGPFL